MASDHGSADRGCDRAPRSATEVVETLERAIVASEVLRDDMERSEDLLRRAKVAVEAGTPILDALECEGHYLFDQRRDCGDAFDDMVRARYDVRMAVLACGLDQGLTMTELAHRMGVSRQRISQVVRSRGFDRSSEEGSRPAATGRTA